MPIRDSGWRWGKIPDRPPRPEQATQVGGFVGSYAQARPQSASSEDISPPTGATSAADRGLNGPGGSRRPARRRCGTAHPPSILAVTKATSERCIAGSFAAQRVDFADDGRTGRVATVGTSMPSALAALRLSSISYLTGACTGRSAVTLAARYRLPAVYSNSSYVTPLAVSSPIRV
jgi:hypothetical protein